MNQNQMKEEIQLIKQMVEKTKKAYAESWQYFSTWGILIILAIAGNYILAFFEVFQWIWVNWIAFMIIGVLYSLFYLGKKEKNRGAKTYSQIAVGHLCFACGIALMLGGFIFPILKLYSYEVIPVIIALVLGIMLFGMGGIYEWNLLKWGGVIWWLGSVAMIFVPWQYRALICIPLIIFGHLVPGFILRSQFQKERIQNES